MASEFLPVVRVADVPEQAAVPWLIRGLWTRQGVGVLGGSPKACKTWLALDLALSVATDTAALGCFAVEDAGPVLLLAAEDSPETVRMRLAGMAARRKLSLADVPIELVLATSLTLETELDQARLQATVARHRPKLLILDPFVRLSRADENSAREVSAVLAFLRRLQRTHGVAILVVHHTRKSARSTAPAGLALRGSGDFWAWSDTTLHLRRSRHALVLTCEHRHAAPPAPVALELADGDSTGPHLRLLGNGTSDAPEPRPLARRVLDALSGDGPRKAGDLRAELRIRMQTLVDTLRALEADRRVRRVDGGWSAIAE